MKTIRRGVFETNSSSTHSISIDEGDLDCKKFDGVIEIDTGEFGREFCDYSDFYSKASYVWTWCANYGNGRHEAILKNVIKDFTGCEVDCKRGTGGYYENGFIDHGSEYLDEMDTLSDEELSKRLKQFLFNSKSILSTGNDNG